MTKYNKLVRDNIPDIIRAKGENVAFRIADEGEYWDKLKDKLKEEVAELIKTEDPHEVADILEVVEAICDARNWSKEEIIALKDKKVQDRGGFKKRIILEEA